MPAHARAERHALADLFDRVGPAAPTLCAGWATADLAAHLVVREQRPGAAAGILVRPLAAYTERVQRQVRDGRSWPALVEAVRSGPPLPLRPVDEQFNTVEYFVHHEDVRRAQAGWEPRPVAADLDRALWQRFRPLGAVLFRRSPVTVQLDAPGVGTATFRKGRPAVTVRADAGELVLFAFGRGEHARVDLEGDAGAVDQLRRASLGL